MQTSVLLSIHDSSASHHLPNGHFPGSLTGHTPWRMQIMTAKVTLQLHKPLWLVLLLFPVHGERVLSSERSSNLPKVTQL